MPESTVVRAPAKVNLRLDIVDRREDGYHLLRMINAPLSLHDEIEIAPSPCGITFTCDRPDLSSASDNLAYRAVQVLMEKAGQTGGVRIHLRKRIPVAAGLGGGSSDAAAVLLALNAWSGFGYSTAELMDLGLILGADVPFFVHGGSALVGGIGERVEPFEVAPGLRIVLMNPGTGLATKEVYAHATRSLALPRYPAPIPTRLVSAEGVAGVMHNDLEPAAASLCPAVNAMKRFLIDRGALAAIVSGSGPTVFGVFPDDIDVAALADERPDPSWRVIPTMTINP